MDMNPSHIRHEDAAQHPPGAASAHAVPVRASAFNVEVPLRRGRLLVYNTLTRALDCLSGEEAGRFLNLGAGASADITGDGLASRLVQAGFLVDEAQDDRLEAQKLYGRLRFDQTHLQLVVAPTLGCNFKCDYCYQGLDKKHGRMTAETRAKVLAFIEARAETLKSVEIHWYGGEPLNDRETIYALSDEVMAFCAARGLTYFSSMVTNGYQLTGEVAEKLSARKVKWAQITLDGPKRTHDTRRILLSGRGSYDRIVENIKQIVARSDMVISLRCNVDTRNIDSVYELIDDLHDNGLANGRVTIYFAPVQTMTRECVDINAFVEEKRSYAQKEMALMRYAAAKGLLQFDVPGNFMSICVGIKANGWVVDPSGNLQKCFDTIQREDLKVGHIDDTEQDLLEDPQLLLWRSWTPFELPTCRSCKLLPSCGGSCAYKFIHNQLTEGDDTRLPCPSLKFSLAERLFEVACARGLTERGDWDEARSPTTPQMMGPSYSPERLDEAIGAFDRMIATFGERASRHARMAEEGSLPESVYAKVDKSRQEYLAMAKRRSAGAAAARKVLRPDG